ncbi:uncharacterized protein si:ch211-63b16.4 isoform X3 [Pangasianodon hypophthalmus]|uniref:uncharacterized protein si:ch211-63b16.4 isoform X3 n=1 Tax=Pangasianodon hypophthalmus TaxID=310915 RepID=UPI002306EEC3|nr:uncharacterized protein si:ch211-63b16.4 isoform X3 [Pangasianodon hypophthalmus]XP_053093717.1 uncharacterized protein si:ch211-63b16.4 isoform X3 [Pangasianodon hypophthalmus]
MGPEDIHQMEQARNSKSFRVVLCLCPPERTEMRTAETRASIRVIGANRVTVDTGRGHRAHILDFDAVWNEGASPKDIYESTAKSLVEYVMKGYNGCVILYGQSTSGETHPVQACTARQRGIISRAAEDIFNSPEASHCRVRVSSYHISNEKIYDLLEPQVSEVCRIHDTEEVVLLEGLRELEVGSAQELMDVYNSGITHRNTGISKGDFASKSHMVLNIMVINMRSKSDKGGLTASKLTLVDLASSGKSAYNSSAVLDMRRNFHVAQENLQEAKTIKRSLTIFRNVIFSLSNTGAQHIPYRESKLTRVLRDCLGGNCRTCLMVTVPTQSSSITETMSCLQFAAQALNVSSRSIHTSQIRYTPAQVQNMWTAEKNNLLLTRTQILPPVSADRRVSGVHSYFSPLPSTCRTLNIKRYFNRMQSQASLPSIVSSAGPLTHLKSKRSLEVSDSRSFLPHLEKPRPPEPSGYHSCGARITEEKNGAVDVCVVKSAIPPSRCLSGSAFVEPLHRHSVEKPSSLLGSSSIAPLLPECSNCKQERKIREEYDKFIIQVKRDRDSLSQRVTELEKELKNRVGEQRENGRVDKDQRRVERDIERQETATGSNETENEKKTEGDEREIGNNKIEKKGNDNRRQHRETEQKEGEREKERERREEREGEKENDSTGKESISTAHGVTEAPKNTEESLLSELHSVRKEYEGLRKSAALSITQLHKEKAELLSHIDDTKTCYEKVCLENADLKARLEALLKEANSRPCSGCNGNTDTHSSHTHTNACNSHVDTRSSHTHTVTTNTEMLVVSHSVCQQCTSDRPQDKGSKCCFSSCSGFPESTEPSEPTSHTCHCERTLHKPNLYKQLRREHSLLLDVMLVLYKREWFLQDAMPYVRRTLKKCGLTLEDSD